MEETGSVARLLFPPVFRIFLKSSLLPLFRLLPLRVVQQQRQQ